MKNKITRTLAIGLLATMMGCSPKPPKMETYGYSHNIQISSNCVAHLVNYYTTMKSERLFFEDRSRTLAITKTLPNGDQVTAYLECKVIKGNNDWSLLRIDGKNREEVYPHIKESKLNEIVYSTGSP